METPPLILIVEDNEEIGPFLAMELETEGYRVELVTDGQTGLMKFRQLEPDMLILDWELPRMSGVELCRRIRQSSHVPILMLTAKQALQERVEGLDAGANDYLVKPFELDELLARIRAQLRAKQRGPLAKLEFADLEMNLQVYQVRRGERQLELSPKEFDLLKYLLEHPRQVLSKSQIFESVWGWDSEGGDSNVEVLVHSLRGKLEEGGEPRLIQTRRGVGYLLQASEA
ncbi:MAG: response regulator transcription factor [Candidatus Sericytochromatia bacterium]